MRLTPLPTLLSLLLPLLPPTTTASYAPAPIIHAIQQQILEPRPTTLSTITLTRTFHEIITTTVPPATPAHSTEAPVQTWYGGQKARGCDRTACASCRWWYGDCRRGEVGW
ncbi:hypothetical protein B0A54_04795 [Friedmanniomyces endolithicus]|uniref:CBM1 domain-containing protein n=1 Tax=Friedmanniomyces endolithicus TaxID=329885 RepID=A0A4V5N8K8_9PEZI|nr:hypothetical protein B0A54_04795 [Friedmanniomyces endolithicus]